MGMEGCLARVQEGLSKDFKEACANETTFLSGDKGKALSEGTRSARNASNGDSKLPRV